MKKRALIISSFPAPYRIAVFKEMAQDFDLDVFFADDKNENRSAEWFYNENDFFYTIVNTKEGRKKYREALSNIKKYDFVIPYDPNTKPSIEAIVLCRLKQVPYFINCDGAIMKHHFLKDYAKKILYSGATACFSSGLSGDQYFQSYGVDKTRIFNHKFTSLESCDILSRRLSSEEKQAIRSSLKLKDRTTVISVGQFIYRKGFDVLLKAWSMLNLDSQLIIIGGGEQTSYYKRYIIDNNLDNVYILDFMKKGQLYKYYDAADVFVLPTREDVWGLVVNEAMGRGLPVITTDRCIAGVELIKNGFNGYIVPVENPSILAERINLLVNDRALRELMAERNIALSQDMTLSQIGRSHVDVINRMLEKKGK